MLVGEVLKTFGTDGGMIVKIDESVPENVEEPVFIRFDGLWVPFYFKSFEPHGKKVKIIFENMESEELAGELVGKKIFSQPEISCESGSEPSDLVGFTVVDSKLGKLGQVNEVFEYPGNPCIEITVNGKQVLIPLNGIKKLEYRKKLIHTTIPEGLLELD
ncbi:MAG: PRC-barrel domain-containing protein [Prevotellaceae bacterium]|jgi:16S rRNA processing protein RimM|nr:PRC-barrel domain-containing protein [Prevotellaceae bacterium]